MHVDRVTLEVFEEGVSTEGTTFHVTADPAFFEILGGDFQNKRVLIRYLDKVYAR